MKKNALIITFADETIVCVAASEELVHKWMKTTKE